VTREVDEGKPFDIVFLDFAEPMESEEMYCDG
jgi:hypothetical protein